MEESAKEGSDGEVRWMDGWMVSYGSGMVLGKVEERGN